MQFDAELIEIAAGARRVAVITGAGISSESGIPTFRGEGGLWRNFRAEDLATPGAFERDPKLVWEWYDWRREVCAQAEPNAAHRTVLAMEDYYPEFLLITQNVDGLHARAGSREIVEIHGSILRGRCTRTGKTFDLPPPPLAELPPLSPFAEGAPARPDVVWFGESYDHEKLGRSLDFLAEADLVFIIGTSGMVPMPVYLAQQAVERGAVAVDVNPERSGATGLARFFLQGKAGEILPPFWEQVRAAG